MAVEVQLSAQQPAPPWELTGERVGTATMVIGAGIISITGVTAVAGYARQADGRIGYRIDTAAEPAFCHHDPRTDLRWCADASGRS